jgi:copper(I)-binding protein
MALAAGVGLVMLAMPVTAAHDYKIGDIRIDHPWARATPPLAAVAGGYLKITNVGKTSDRLLSGSTEFAEKVEFHVSTVEEGVARMRPLINGLRIGAGETIELAPGRMHVMFIKPSRSLKEDERFTATLNFARAGTIKVEFVVQGMAAQPPGKSDHEGHGARTR